MPAVYDVRAALERIENELIDSMMRNLRRHLKEESEMGFDWEMWQVKQLRYLEEYRKRNAKEYGPQFASINRRIKNAITHARTSGQKDEEIRILETMKEHPELMEGRKASNGTSVQGGDFFRINEKKFKALVKATTNDMTKAEHAVLRRCNDQYRKIIFNAQMYANSGAGTVEKAVDMATHDFLKRGIDSIVYKNGARHTISDYADMVLRTAERRATHMGAGEMRKEWGMDLVIVNRRGSMKDGNFGHACPLCIPWLGKILIDDIYSGGKPDGKHQLLSAAVAQGFQHPRCKDTFTTYFPGISSMPDPVTETELKKGAEKEKQNAQKKHAERQAEKYGRLAEYSLDPENRRKYEARASEWGQKSEELTERRKQRLAQRRTPEASSEQSVEFDDRVSEKQRQILEQLSAQYRTRLQKVTIGAERAAGDVDISGSRMRLSGKDPATAIHEFAHTLANTSADKYGLTHDQEFWAEIKKIRKEYMKAVEGDPSRWISSYEHSSKSLDEFMAEAFTHAKMREMGLSIPDKYGNDFTYSQKVMEAVNKHFGKEISVAESGRLARAARDMGVKYAEYGKLPKETANILNDALETLPPEARPLFVGDSATLEQYRGAKLPRKSSQFYGVTIDAPPDGLLLGNDPVSGRMKHDFDAHGSMVGISSKYNTPAKIEAAKKKSQEAYMAKHDGRKWYFNEKGEATIYHEMGHAYQEKFGLPEGFEVDAARWAKESGCDMLKTPSEAFSEAWGAYHTGNPDLPDYIAKYIENASNTPINTVTSSVAKFDEDVIIKHIKEVLIPAQKTDVIVPRQAIHRQGTKMFLQRAADLAAKKEYGPGYITITDDEILALVEQYKGTGEVKYNKDGEWDRKETILDNDLEVGIVVNNKTGKSVPTSVFRIYYSDRGIHIAPDYPSKKRRAK